MVFSYLLQTYERCDTPGVQTALPNFRESLGSTLRTSEQGADTIIWAAISSDLNEIPSGSFLFDRAVASEHLPFCSWITSPSTDIESLVEELEVLINGL